MTEKTLNTIIVLRNDKSTDWATSDVILKEGELGVSYLDNGNVVVKAGDGTNKWSMLKQLEGVFEQPVTLTQSFGYFTVPTGGATTFNGENGTVDTEGMTTTEFLMTALKKAVNPTVTHPSVSMTASVSNSGAQKEVGSYVTQINWDGTNNLGSYKIGSAAATSSGLTASSFTWATSNNINSASGTGVDGNFTLSDDHKKQITGTTEQTIATITAKVTLNPASAITPKNNLGEDVASLKIAGFDTAGTTEKTLTADAKVTGFHKPFWGVIAASADIKSVTEYTSSDVRGLANSANSTKGFPTSLSVPAGSQQVIFFARAGAYSSLTATDSKAMNAEVSFTKVANAVKVKGNNEYAPEGTTGFDYDLWYVDWNAGIGAAKELVLAWS